MNTITITAVNGSKASDLIYTDDAGCVYTHRELLKLAQTNRVDVLAKASELQRVTRHAFNHLADTSAEARKACLRTSF